MLIPSQEKGSTYILYDYGNDGTYEVGMEVDGYISAITPRTGSVDGITYLSSQGLPIIMEGDDGLNSLIAAPAGYGFLRADASRVGEVVGIIKEKGISYVPSFGNLPNPVHSVSWSSCAPGETCPVKVELIDNIETNYYLIAFNASMIPLNAVEVTPNDSGKNIVIANLTAPLHGTLRIYAVGDANGTTQFAGITQVTFMRFDNEKAHPSLDPNDGVPGASEATPPPTTAPITPHEGTAAVNGEGYREAQLSKINIGLGWAREVVKSYQQSGSYELPQTPATGKQACTATTTTSTTTATQTTTSTPTGQGEQESTTTTETTATTQATTTTTSTESGEAGQAVTTVVTTPAGGVTGQTTLIIAGVLVAAVIVGALFFLRR